jgi:hypothetical protein
MIINWVGNGGRSFNGVEIWYTGEREQLYLMMELRNTMDSYLVRAKWRQHLLQARPTASRNVTYIDNIAGFISTVLGSNDELWEVSLGALIAMLFTESPPHTLQSPTQTTSLTDVNDEVQQGVHLIQATSDTIQVEDNPNTIKYLVGSSPSTLTAERAAGNLHVDFAGITVMAQTQIVSVLWDRNH